MDIQTPSDDLHASTDDDCIYRVERDGDEPLPGLVVLAVAAVTGHPPADLPPLNDRVDPDALEAVFAPRTGGATRRGGRVQFPFGGCEVEVDPGAVTVRLDT
jgi:hypothetical protein